MFPRNKVLSMSPEKIFLEEFVAQPAYTNSRISRNDLNPVTMNKPTTSETVSNNDMDIGLKECSLGGRGSESLAEKLVERGLWLCTFAACISIAAYMINEVWTQYYNNPVIVTFNPSEHSIDRIPFPAVTVCNMNPFSKARVNEYEKIYRQAESVQDRNAALDALRVIYGICSSQPSFMKSRGFASKRDFNMIPEATEGSSPHMNKNLTDFLMNNTQSCGQMLRYCKWEGKEFECDRLFRPILTDFGMCCTFNALPRQRMFRENLYEPTKFKENPFWNASEVIEWRKWKYQSSLMVDHGLRYPFRQQKAGMLYGLSVLIDPDVENSFCPASDSEGVKILLHAPIEAARVVDLGSIVGLNREAFLQANPDVTVSHPGISDYEPTKRNCYFGKEYKLNYFKPYTKANCQEECWNTILRKSCNCVMYYTPRKEKTNVCSFSPNSNDYICVKRAEAVYYKSMDRECGHCIYSCNNLAYNTEGTSAKLQPRDTLLPQEANKSNEDSRSDSWMGHKLSIVHIYMGSDTVVPKLRRKLYNTIDLIANTGGLLGLSLGFSVLSAAQVIYRLIIHLIKTGYRFGVRYYHSKVYLQGHTRNMHGFQQNTRDFRGENKMLMRSFTDVTRTKKVSTMSTLSRNYEAGDDTARCTICTCFKA